MNQSIADVIDLVEPSSQHILSPSVDEARDRVRRGDVDGVLAIDGSFALTAVDGIVVRLARSLDRPLRYFLAKAEAGPYLIVAERIDAIRAALDERGQGDQFHPSYTRMVPAHHVTTLQLVGCPDPQATYQRFFAPPRAVASTDLDALGDAYVGTLLREVESWLRAQDPQEPLGVLFSGGVDSGAVLLAVYDRLLHLGQAPQRLKAFTLAVDGGGADLRQAREFLSQVDLEYLHEAIEVPASAVDPLRAVELIEDYKPRDVECAAVALALLEALRTRYPDWRLLVDGDGGDENLKDYPIEENSELTIRSVVGNSMLYQEGWGVEALKHSLTYSGGLSRGCVRTFAPARQNGFVTFSPFMRPELIRVAESIPFDALTGGEHDRLYALKGEIVARGFSRHLGIDFPRFAKRRFQEGAVDEDGFGRLFPPLHQAARQYRRHYLVHGV